VSKLVSRLGDRSWVFEHRFRVSCIDTSFNSDGLLIPRIDLISGHSPVQSGVYGLMSESQRRWITSWNLRRFMLRRSWNDLTRGQRHWRLFFWVAKIWNCPVSHLVKDDLCKISKRIFVYSSLESESSLFGQFQISCENSTSEKYPP